jgi:hypothetical protein
VNDDFWDERTSTLSAVYDLLWSKAVDPAIWITAVKIANISATTKPRMRALKPTLPSRRHQVNMYQIVEQYLAGSYFVRKCIYRSDRPFRAVAKETLISV